MSRHQWRREWYRTAACAAAGPAIRLAACAAILATCGGRAAAQSPSPGDGVRKPSMADTVKANIYADNWFVLYINGELVAVDSIKFIPHNVVSVDILPSYPMTIAVMAKDNADPKTGMEYANTHIGDGGFILKFGDGTVTSAQWKAKRFSWGPIDRDTKNPRVENIPIPDNWQAVDFDDSSWGHAEEYTQEQVGPKQPFFEHDFKGARFIWTGDLELDNTVIFRHRVAKAPDGKPRPDFSNLNNIVPAGRPGPGGRRPPGEGPRGDGPRSDGPSANRPSAVENK